MPRERGPREALRQSTQYRSSPEDLASGARAQGAGRFVSEDDAGSSGPGTSEGDSLPLPTGQPTEAAVQRRA